MLRQYDAFPALPVSDLERARRFYEDVLGFQPGDEFPGGVTYASGDVHILVYPSAFAGTNKGTAVGFEVPPEAFDAEVAALRAAGITFQTFEMDQITWDDGVATWSDENGPDVQMRSVWFEDPDGNILNVGTRFAS
jgi:catechol 2,3-dioxygenase-like lactoylglutathione lyase family enzyme